jgi:alanyl-tRNA synthetase
MQSDKIRQRFLDFFEDRGHAILPSASLVPKDDPSVLFTTAGMQPLAPYLMGQDHPKGKRLANVQKCVRTQDIEEVGDDTHDTFFEMLGNWSLGDYFKEEAVSWSYQFLTDEKQGLGLDPDRLYVTCYEGDSEVDKDTKSAQVWQSLGVPNERIFFLGKEDNWWSPGEDGPCGPDTEMFYDVTDDGLDITNLSDFKEADGRQQIIEIWNNVFMQYEQEDGEVISQLSQKNVDTGAGLERLAMVMQGVGSIFDTDLFRPIMKQIDRKKEESDRTTERIVADHIRTAVFIAAEGVTPDNSGRGYVLRRILRRAVEYGDKLGISDEELLSLTEPVITIYKDWYTEVGENKQVINEVITEETHNFRQTLKRGKKQFKKIDGDISGKQAFDLYQSHGLPLSVTKKLAEDKGVAVDEPAFHEEMKKHKEKSRQAGEKQFKGGLANQKEETVQLHTATHLLNQVLRDVLGDHVTQEGSNITTERLRFDFAHPDALSVQEIKEIEMRVNKAIRNGLVVSKREKPRKEAKEEAIYLEQANYPDKVTVYKIVYPDNHPQAGEIFSKEICRGPHVDNTDELGEFEIIKEESSSAGVRRIKATLTPES